MADTRNQGRQQSSQQGNQEDRQSGQQSGEGVTARRTYGETQPPRNDLKEHRRGPHDNQLTGQTVKGSDEDKGRS